MVNVVNPFGPDREIKVINDYLDSFPFLHRMGIVNIRLSPKPLSENTVLAISLSMTLLFTHPVHKMLIVSVHLKIQPCATMLTMINLNTIGHELQEAIHPVVHSNKTLIIPMAQAMAHTCLSTYLDRRRILPMNEQG
jgi:hypothetical protein